MSPETVLALYHTFISNDVIKDDLQDANGDYMPENKWNNSVNHAMHLVSQPNNLFAEIRLAADATIVRKREDGTVITDQDELISCANFGRAGRHSDPSIGSAVNGLARDELARQITLEDPFGLYIDKDSLDRSSDFELPPEAPDGAHPRDYWTILRGTDDYVLRAQYTVPAEQGSTVGDIKIDNEPIRYGGQIASKMQIKLTAVYADIGSDAPEAFFCQTPEILGFLDADLRPIRLPVPAGVAGGVTVLCSAVTDPAATVTTLDNRATLRLGTEIPITTSDFRVFEAEVSVAAGIAAGGIFFEVTNPDGRRGIPSDPGLIVVAPEAPIDAGAAVAARGASPDLSSYGQAVELDGRGLLLLNLERQ